MLQRVVYEAQAAPSQDRNQDILMAKAKYFAVQDAQQSLQCWKEEEQVAKKRLNLEKNIQRLKERLGKKPEKEPPEIIVVDEGSSSECDDVDVVGGDGPTAAEFTAGVEVSRQ